MKKIKCQREFERYNVESSNILHNISRDKNGDYIVQSTRDAYHSFMGGWQTALASQEVEIVRKVKSINSKELRIDSVKIGDKEIYKHKATVNKNATI